MNSDFKYWPSALPRVLQSGYSNRHKPNVIRTTMSDGYVRQRLVNQGAPDTVSCSVCLIESDYRQFIQWFKGDIRCGQDWFVMPLLSVDEDQKIQYRYVRIQNGELNAQLVSTNATRGSIYRVSFTLDASNTVVDDGSWEDHYLPTSDDGSAQGEFIAIPTADIIDDADDLGDSSGTYTIIEE